MSHSDIAAKQLETIAGTIYGEYLEVRNDCYDDTLAVYMACQKHFYNNRSDIYPTLAVFSTPTDGESETAGKLDKAVGRMAFHLIAAHDIKTQL